MNFVKQVWNEDKTIMWAQCSVESCDFECDFSHLIEAQIHELMHIIDFRLADIFNASIRNL